MVYFALTMMWYTSRCYLLTGVAEWISINTSAAKKGETNER
uniref:Rich Immunoreceptor tyrosine-based activation motif n=2 Tax=unclassified Caudoviricetes TaxID=2788787 RepID=A0A8S5UN61_9CAUD|nr:MAG TPA: rich Immunoreceptor tyrosine-based activation motif [Siphoviridae sp. ctsus30]DAF95860.1 MAG TPA: rich Immunoreceptor tyrosine-based activation motif [Siphoviridae sp. ctKGQ3]